MDEKKIPKRYAIILDAVVEHCFVQVFLLPLLWAAGALVLSYLIQSDVLDKQKGLIIFGAYWGVLAFPFKLFSPFYFIASSSSDKDSTRIHARYRKTKVVGDLKSLRVDDTFLVTVSTKSGDDKSLSVPVDKLNKACFIGLKKAAEEIDSDHIFELKGLLERVGVSAKIQEHELFQNLVAAKGPRYSFTRLASIIVSMIFSAIVLFVS